MDKVILKQENDSVVIILPINQDIDAFVAANPGCVVVDKSSLPKDREFRGAWTLEGKIDLNKAKKIWQQKIRIIRDKKLQKMDIDWMQAMEQGNSKIAAAIAAKKQILRDLPQREELTKAESVEALKSFWPEILED